MGKQTRKSGSKFGGEWTKIKLSIISEYLKEYSIALKNQNFVRIYVDAFAGSGKTDISKEEEHQQDLLFEYVDDIVEREVEDQKVLEGSALKALNYNFDYFIFIELDSDRMEKLIENIKEKYPYKLSRCIFFEGDANQLIDEIKDLIAESYTRCVMFLDPYSLELKWSSLEKISKINGVDIWYLFPLTSLRLIPNDFSKLEEDNISKINELLGTDEWINVFYKKKKEISLFGEKEVIYRVDYEEIIDFIVKRLETLFPYVFSKTRNFTNSKNALMFKLLFMMTNNSPKAVFLADKLVNGVYSHICKIYQNY